MFHENQALTKKPKLNCVTVFLKLKLSVNKKKAFIISYKKNFRNKLRKKNKRYCVNKGKH